MLRVILLTLGDPGRLTGGYLYHRRMAEAAPRHGACLAFVSLPERPFPLAVTDALRTLRQVRQSEADVLVVDSIAAAFLGPWLALCHSDLPFVAMLHQPPGGIDHGVVRTWLQARLDRLGYDRARLLMVASDALAEDLATDGIPRAQLRVVAPGRDVAERADTSQGDLRRGRNVALLCVGNWVPRKGIVDLLEAFARLPADAATLHLAGDDHADLRYARRVRARLAAPDLARRVVVHGPLSTGGVAALYAGADVFVLPSLREPYGTVYGEAMAYGLPVVGWRAGNLPYLAEHNREGFALDPGDSEALTRALMRLAADGALRRRMGDAARTRALTRPTWAETAALFFSTLRDAAGR